MIWTLNTVYKTPRIGLCPPAPLSPAAMLECVAEWKDRLLGRDFERTILMIEHSQTNSKSYQILRAERAHLKAWQPCQIQPPKGFLQCHSRFSPVAQAGELASSPWNSVWSVYGALTLWRFAIKRTIIGSDAAFNMELDVTNPETVNWVSLKWSFCHSASFLWLLSYWM